MKIAINGIIDTEPFIYCGDTIEEVLKQINSKDLEILKTYSVSNEYQDGYHDIIETLDEDNEPILLDNYGNQIMMYWEKDYMHECIDHLDPYGDVLEFGFGLGLSADRIMQYDINSYTVIESDPLIFNKAKKWAEKYNSAKVNVVFGRWQDVIFQLGKFDCFFFDTAELYDTPDGLNMLMNLVFNCKATVRFGAYCAATPEQYNILNDATLVYYKGNNKVEVKIKNGFEIKHFKESLISVPKKCEYINAEKKLYVYVIECDIKKILNDISTDIF